MSRRGVTAVRVPVHAAADRGKVALRAGVLVFGGAVIVRGALLERRLRQLLLREREAAAHLSARQSQLTRRNEQLAEESRRDALTRLRNRHALADDLPALTALCRGSQEPVAFAICDIDHFKAYNDRLGHLAGDDALQAIAATVDGALRSDDVAYRFGGEELLLVLRNTDAHSALAVAERVRAAVERVRLSGRPHPFPPMNSRERRMLHMLLSESGLPTASSGEGPGRFVVLYPKGADTSAPYNLSASGESQPPRRHDANQVRNAFRPRF